MPKSSSAKRGLIEVDHAELSVRRQCELLELERSTFYYQPCTESAENLKLMRAIDELYLERPFYGSRRIADELTISYETVKEHVQHLLKKIGVTDRTQAAVWAVRNGILEQG